MEIKDCDCIRNVQIKIKEHLSNRERNPNGFEITETNWETASCYPKERLYINCIVESTFKKKDGTISKPKKEKVAMFFTFCPFCGKKYSD